MEKGITLLRTEKGMTIVLKGTFVRNTLAFSVLSDGEEEIALFTFDGVVFLPTGESGTIKDLEVGTFVVVSVHTVSHLLNVRRLFLERSNDQNDQND